jgi:hypothetical protein
LTWRLRNSLFAIIARDDVRLHHEDAGELPVAHWLFWASLAGSAINSNDRAHATAEYEAHREAKQSVIARAPFLKYLGFSLTHKTCWHRMLDNMATLSRHALRNTRTCCPMITLISLSITTARDSPYRLLDIVPLMGTTPKPSWHTPK